MKEIPKRYTVGLMCFVGLFNAFAMRVNVSVTIVAMVNHTRTSSYGNSSYGTECPLTNENELELKNEETLQGERFDWPPLTQGYILSAFFYGYFLTVFPGGYVAKKFGAVRVFGYCMFTTVVLTLVTPTVVRCGLVPFLVLRFFVGIAEGVSIPTMTAIISSWSPRIERSRMTSLILMGMSLGNVFSFTVSGLISSSDSLGGWPTVFYMFGTVGIVWFIVWKIFIYESPFLHPTITKEELSKFENSAVDESQRRKIPWKCIVSSCPFWAIVVTFWGHLFGFTFMTMETPTYLYTIQHFNTRLSGVLTSLPSISEALGALISSVIADKLIAAERLSTTNVRKIFNSIGGFAPSICLVVAAFSGCRATFIVAIFCVGLFLNGFKYSGSHVALIDMSPNFCGILVGFAGGLANIASCIAPTMVGMITANGSTLQNWSYAFFITAAIQSTTAAVFAVFGSAEMQPWDSTELQPLQNDKKQLKTISLDNITLDKQ